MKRVAEANRVIHIPAAWDKDMLTLYAYALDAHAYLERDLQGTGAPDWVVRVDVEAYYSKILHKQFLLSLFGREHGSIPANGQSVNCASNTLLANAAGCLVQHGIKCVVGVADGGVLPVDVSLQGHSGGTDFEKRSRQPIVSVAEEATAPISPPGSMVTIYHCRENSNDCPMRHRSAGPVVTGQSHRKFWKTSSFNCFKGFIH